MRRKVLWLLGLVLVAPLFAAHALEVPVVRDLRQEAAQISDERTPLLLMFYAEHCTYCRRMEDEFLEPMLISGDYDQKVVIRRVALDAGSALRDFNGETITGAELAERYQVFVTPTLVFLDARGNPLAEKMVGLTTPDFFGGYLDAAIDTALMRLRGPDTGSTSVAGKIDESCNPLC
jgi:thioredoxin-related protein